MIITLKMYVENILEDRKLFVQCVCCFFDDNKAFCCPCTCSLSGESEVSYTDILYATFLALKEIHNTRTFAIEVFGSS